MGDVIEPLRDEHRELLPHIETVFCSAPLKA
jgi:hypothetical protein